MIRVEKLIDIGGQDRYIIVFIYCKRQTFSLPVLVKKFFEKGYGDLYSINSNSSSFFTSEANSTPMKPVDSVKLILIVCDCVAWVEVYLMIVEDGNKLFIFKEIGVYRSLNLRWSTFIVNIWL